MSWTIKYQKTNEFKKQTHNYTQCPMTRRQGKQRWTCGFVATGATPEERIRQLKAHHSCENCPIVYGRYTPFGYYTNWVNDHYDAENPLQPPINPELVNEGLLKGEKKGIYCAKHKLEGMVDVKNKRCAEPGCNKGPSFNMEGEEKALYCKRHGEPKGMVNVVSKRCRQEGCGRIPCFNYEGLRKLVCREHKSVVRGGHCRTPRLESRSRGEPSRVRRQSRSESSSRPSA